MLDKAKRVYRIRLVVEQELNKRRNAMKKLFNKWKSRPDLLIAKLNSLRENFKSTGNKEFSRLADELENLLLKSSLL